MKSLRQKESLFVAQPQDEMPLNASVTPVPHFQVYEHHEEEREDYQKVSDCSLSFLLWFPDLADSLLSQFE